jgi:hypothetical protein
MTRERSGTIRQHGQSDLGRCGLPLSDELAPLPDWSQVGRHILAEAMRRAMVRMNARLAEKDAASVDSQAKELS